MSSLGWPAAAIFVVLAGATALAAPPAADPAEILKRADASHDAFAEGVIALHVVVNERGKKPVEGGMEVYVKGADTSLAVFAEGKQKGRKILTVGDHVWLIVPGASRPVPVSKSQRLMGAASFGDVAPVSATASATARSMSAGSTAGASSPRAITPSFGLALPTKVASAKNKK
jgi:hypothetical protein